MYMYVIIIMSGGETRTTNKKSRCSDHRDRKEASMKYFHGTWFYQGQAYKSLSAALKAAWPK